MRKNGMSRSKRRAGGLEKYLRQRYKVLTRKKGEKDKGRKAPRARTKGGVAVAIASLTREDGEEKGKKERWRKKNWAPLTVGLTRSNSPSARPKLSSSLLRFTRTKTRG